MAFPSFWTGRLILKWPLGLGYTCPWGPFPTSRERRLHFQMGAVARAGVPRGAARFSDGRRCFAMGAQGGVSNFLDRPLDLKMGAGAAVWVPRGAVSNFGDQRLYFQMGAVTLVGVPRGPLPTFWTRHSSFKRAQAVSFFVSELSDRSELHRPVQNDGNKKCVFRRLAFSHLLSPEVWACARHAPRIGQDKRRAHTDTKDIASQLLATQLRPVLQNHEDTSRAPFARRRGKARPRHLPAAKSSPA